MVDWRAFLERIQKDNGLSNNELARRMKIHPQTIANWKKYNSVRLTDMQHALSCIGYEIVIVRKKHE